MKKFILILVIILFSGELYSQELLDEYLKTAAKNNPALMAKFKDYLAAAERTNQAGELPDPQFAFGYFISPVETRVGPQQAKLSLTQKFPWFGELNAEKDFTAQRAKVVYSEFEKMKYDLYFKVRKTWYQLYVIRQKQDFLSEQAKFYSTFENLALIRFESGEGGMSEILSIRDRIDEVEKEEDDLRRNFESLGSQFMTLLGVDTLEIQFPDSLETPFLEEDYKAYLERALASNSELQRLNQMQLAELENLRIAEAKGMPDFAVGLDYVFTGEREGQDLPDNGKDVFMPMLSFSIPFNRGKYNSMEKEIGLRLEAVQQRIEDEKNNIEEELITALNNYRIAQSSIELYEKLLRNSQTSLDILLDEYGGDYRSFNLVLQTRERYLNYEFLYESSKAEMSISASRIRQILSDEKFENEDE